MSRLERPLLVFDGDCGFCRAWIARWRLATGDAVDYAPSQAVAERFPAIPPERFRDAVVLIEPEGHVCFGAEAVFRSRSFASGRGLGLWLYERVPGAAAVSERAYRLVARHRSAFTVLTRLLWGDHVVPPGERITAWVFLRLLAAVYVAAFASIGVQIVGLAGRQGILPVAGLLEQVAQHYGPGRLWLLPTLCWVNASDASLLVQAGAGMLAALALLAGVAPALMLVVLWVLYLSLSTAGQEFLWFQWDSLLLEAGFLAIFVAPLGGRSRPARDPPPSRGAVWLLRWLLFRLMFSSAVVKLSSGDPTWRGLTALQYHFETQPLPPWTAWYAHHLSPALLRASTIVMFAVEGAAPFLVFAPRRPRVLGAFAMAAFQVIIGATGNYGFFNGLSIALCVLLLDDGVWPAWVRRRLGGTTGAPEGAEPGRWPAAVLRPVLAVVFVTSLVPLVSSFRHPAPWLTPLYYAYRVLSPLHVVNPYGLFAVMTTSRSEIIVEGSDDGLVWKPYEFRWKPGDVGRRPAFVAPHMPRLDWQLWFAALDTQRIQPWYLGFCARLLENSRPVLALLERNPFPDHPPRYLRSLVYDYHFTDAATRRAAGAWWRREPRGTYGPPLTLEAGRLAVAPLPLPMPEPAP